MLSQAKKGLDAGEVTALLLDLNIHTQDIAQVIQALKPLYLEKGEAFCVAGKYADRLGILINGLVMAEFDTDDGKLNVSRFFYTPHSRIVSNFESFKHHTPSTETILALENSLLLCINSEELKTLSASTISVNAVARHFAEESYIMALQRIHDLQVLNNEQRIAKFLRKMPELYNRIPIKYLASYLRVNRNDPSRVFKEMINNNK